MLVREVSALYGAFASGREPELPALPVQYADYAVWQRAWLSGEMLERQIAWWRDRLEGAPALLELPTDRARPQVQDPRAGSVAFSFSPEISQRLRALARGEGATLFMVLLAGWQVLLSRYAGQEDVVVGSPIAGRTRAETEGLIGFFVNTLVLRADLSGDPSFRELLGRVREATLGAYAHQELPFERLVEEVAPVRSLSHTPLFQVLFALQNNEPDELELGGLAMEPLAGAGEGVAKFDLELALEEAGGALRGSLSYRAELWDAPTLERMAGHFATLLERVAAGPDLPLSALELPDAAERAQLLEEWSTSGAPVLPGRCVHELFTEQAARTPGAVALVQGEARLTYAELERRANGLAHHLVRRGVGPEARVGICAERSPELVVALLAVLKAGGAYVPLDPQYPAERLAFMLSDAEVGLLLAQPHLLGRLPEFGGKVVLLDGGSPPPCADAAPEVAVTAENAAYVIYTSGSTGRPKGTEVPHRAIPGFFRGADYARFDEAQVLLHYSSASWDALTLELYPALLCGATCVLHPAGAPEPARLEEEVRLHGVTTLWMTAAFFNLVVDTRPELLGRLGQLMVGGEALSPPHVRRALELAPGLRLVNGYGPSECTVFTSCHRVSHDLGAAAVPIGRPVGDRRVYLLDRYLNPVPVGVPGELFVGGPGVARGYLNRPGLTGEKFVPDPFGGEPGARLYRTADRARWLSDGVLEYLGRVDAQVKIRGFRIEPGEVEALLAAHPAVREAAVVVREDVPGEKRLVAYTAGDAQPAELREHLKGQLPEYMVPGAFVALERLPLTPNGKVDRAALPAPEAGSGGGEHVAPRTPTEELLAGIWAQVLGTERVGAADDFFALGGHSLLATRVVSRVREALGVELPLRALFEAPTVAALAERIQALSGAAGAPPPPPLVPVPRDPRSALPLSFAQQRLWLIDRLEPGSVAYNMPFPLRLRGRLDVGALERALSALVHRHEALRTVFASVGGEPVQVLRAAEPVVLAVADLRGHAGAEVLRQVEAEGVRPFD
ncbi:MAG TPA: amino acid adenylation domain-containing protein, partial [Longimicrobiaceae bacterium]|nr:amino acid adenylation domain-containing protein [Longimicrobiaceae bacterium]